MDMISVSIGFTIPETSIPWGPAFLGPIAERVRREADVPVSSAWGFGTPEIAERVVADKQLDLVMVGRSHLANPHWPLPGSQRTQGRTRLVDLACAIRTLAGTLLIIDLQQMGIAIPISAITP